MDNKNHNVQELIEYRLGVLQLAETLGSISEACRRSGMDRTSFYEWKKRYEQYGLEGLKDLPPVHKHHPQTTPDHISERILSLSKQNPEWGCVRIAKELQNEGIKISSPTIQKILIKNGMGMVRERVAKLEEESLKKGTKLSENQLKLIEKVDRCFKERHYKCERPGQLLIQDTVSIGKFQNLGHVYMQTVVDPHSSYVFALLHSSKHPRYAIRVFHQEILPFYQKKNIKVECVVTGASQEFCGKDRHPFSIYLGLNGIDHEKKESRNLKKNGFIEHFFKTAKEEFFKPAEEEGSYESLEELQAALALWLHHYNHQRPNLSFPALGKTPYSVIHDFRFPEARPALQVH